MTKRQTIDEIMSRNPSARPDFLAPFSAEELHDYLRQLRSLEGVPHREEAGEAAEQAVCLV